MLNTRALPAIMLGVIAMICIGASPRPSPEQILKWCVAAPRPEYPLEARTRHATGSGVFKLRVRTETGTVRRVEILQSSGDKALDATVIKAFSQWRFRAGVLPSIRSLNPQTKEPFADEDFLIKIPVSFTMASGKADLGGPFGSPR